MSRGGFARRVTTDTIDGFKPLLRAKGQRAVEDLQATAGPDGVSQSEPTTAIAEKHFDGVSIIIPNKYHTHPATSMSGTDQPDKMATSPTRRLLWRKVLSATDSQRQTGNATGDLRLTQAGFQVDDKPIDHRTYFRDTVFSEGTWSEAKFSEVATFTFDVTLFGVHRGRHRLEVSHKRSGEAGQGNYTTNIRWGPLMPVLRLEVDITGKTLNLYSATLENRPHFQIDII